MTRIFDIEIYRDGGSVEFRVDNGSGAKHIWLETPFRGEPRALLIDTVAVPKGDPRVADLLEDIEQWRAALPPAIQAKIEEVLSHKGPFYNPDEVTAQAIEVSRVLAVGNYLERVYRV